MKIKEYNFTMTRSQILKEFSRLPKKEQILLVREVSRKVLPRDPLRREAFLMLPIIRAEARKAGITPSKIAAKIKEIRQSG